MIIVRVIGESGKIYNRKFYTKRKPDPENEKISTRHLWDEKANGSLHITLRTTKPRQGSYDRGYTDEVVAVFPKDSWHSLEVKLDA